MKKLLFDPEATREVEEAADYYREIDPKLAVRFVADLAFSSELLMRFPASGSPLTKNLRKRPLRGFPFSLIYWDDTHQEAIFVFALAHHARKPGYWRGRL